MNIGDSGNIFIERAHPAYAHVIDFLVSCCEPVSRTQHMEQYRMDSSSLSAATAEGTYSLAMIDTILRHYRLNDRQELAIDLERCVALQQLATALDEANANVEDVVAGGAEASAAQQSWARSVAAQVPLPPCLRGVDFSNTVLAPFYPTQNPCGAPPAKQAAAASGPTATVKTETVDDDAVSGPRAAVTTRAAASSPSPSPSAPRRVLQLFNPAPSSNAKAAATAVPSSSSSPNSAAASSLVSHTRPAQVPLISLAVTAPAEVAAPLPESIAAMLAEEENASRVHIVLQPRLRRFHQFEAHQQNLSSSSSLPSAQSAVSLTRTRAGKASAEESEELFYFIESRQRAHLELVLEAVKEFLEPVMLYGKPRWILSDVDRSPLSAGGEAGTRGATRAAHDAGRPAVLRTLYQPPADTTSRGNDASSPGAASAREVVSSRFVYKCQVRDGKLREVKERLFSRFGIRADCYYDYMQDQTLHVERLSLASHVRLRPYQVASLERFKRGSKAHQGVIVLPCGAGKTLTGIGAAAAMHKTTIVMCVNNMSVFQWQREFLRWTDLTEEEVTVCTAKVKQMPGKVFITTYNMVIAKRGSSDGAAAEESRAILQAMTSQAWGLLLLDEVHTALAHHFQDVLNTIKYKCVLGLSATLLREDDKIGDLRHLVGPKLYEANWLELTRGGFLANVECAEVQCPMPLPFLKAYRDLQRARVMLGAGRAVGKRSRTRRSAVDGSDDDEAGAGRRRRRRRGLQGGRPTSMGLSSRALRLASCNPYKLWCTQALLTFHQQRSPPDKVIIFCDYLADVRFFAHHLHLPFMDQRTSEAERTNLLQYFQFSAEVNAIILTRVGDVALDLPCASVIIQVSGLGASRRQEAQRLGRILRPKPPSLDNTCAYFYTLVSQDTADIRTSYRRQSWLRDQGFAYRILHSDRIMHEFLRVGGQPCCVGPPQWWYQSTTPSSSVAPGSPLVCFDGVYWAPFSVEAATKVERAFQQGRDSCLLKGSELGSATVRPTAAELGHYALRASEAWEITFSSADAPQTFGTVRIGEGGGDTTLRVRRVRRGCLDSRHRCTEGADGCLTHALQSVFGGRSEVAAAGSGSDESEDEEEEDGDSAMDDD